MAASWRVEQRRGTASALHAGWPTVERWPEVAAIGVCTPQAPAVVLGSTQSEQVVDEARASAAGIEVARRRSGGGAVLVTPDDPVWIDVWVPAAHPLWRLDVAHAFDWLGDAWADALTSIGRAGLVAHRQGYLACTRWSGLVCFGGVGTGEVVTPAGRKVVGLAQRRNRAGAWFHGACVLHWDPALLVDVLALHPDERVAAVEDLAQAVVGVRDLADSGDLRVGSGRQSVDREVVVAALIGSLLTR